MTKKICVISDAAYPLAHGGFSVAVRPMIDGLLEAGYQVWHVARGTTFDKNDMPESWRTTFRNQISVVSCPASDLNGYQYLGYLCGIEHFNAMVYLADAHSVVGWLQNIEVRPIPTLFYGPTEGAPLCRPGSNALAEIVVSGGIITTYTNFSAQTITESVKKLFAEKPPDFNVHVIPHGSDHGDFRVLPQEERDSIREKLRWTNRKVVMNVARNAGRKMWVPLLQAIALLKDEHPEILLYAHTVPFENFFLEGHNLPEIIDELGIKNHVVFPQNLWDAHHGMGYEKMIERYNAADMFVSPSAAEGWNLPLIEAARCGLPAAVTAYSGMWEWSKDFAIPLIPRTWFRHSSGGVLGLVQPEQIADVIDQTLSQPDVLELHADKGIGVSKSLSWDVLKNRTAELVEQLVGK